MLHVFLQIKKDMGKNWANVINYAGQLRAKAAKIQREEIAAGNGTNPDLQVIIQYSQRLIEMPQFLRSRYVLGLANQVVNALAISRMGKVGRMWKSKEEQEVEAALAETDLITQKRILALLANDLEQPEFLTIDDALSSDSWQEDTGRAELFKYLTANEDGSGHELLRILELEAAPGEALIVETNMAEKMATDHATDDVQTEVADRKTTIQWQMYRLADYFRKDKMHYDVAAVLFSNLFTLPPDGKDVRCDLYPANSVAFMACDQYTDMMDPNGEIFNLRDSEWDMYKETALQSGALIPLSASVAATASSGVKGLFNLATARMVGSGGFLKLLGNTGRLLGYGTAIAVEGATFSLTHRALLSAEMALVYNRDDWKSLWLQEDGSWKRQEIIEDMTRSMMLMAFIRVSGGINKVITAPLRKIKRARLIFGSMEIAVQGSVDSTLFYLYEKFRTKIHPDAPSILGEQTGANSFFDAAVTNFVMFGTVRAGGGFTRYIGNRLKGLRKAKASGALATR
jgi:hypothetical protein